MVKTPGVVYAIAMAINAFTKEGDAVLIQEPVYYPFGEVITDNKREKIVNTLKYVDGEYGIEIDKVKIGDEDKINLSFQEAYLKYGEKRITRKTDNKKKIIKILLKNDEIQRTERLEELNNKAKIRTYL